MTILIREAEVEQLLPMDKALLLVEQGLLAMGQGKAQNRPRQRVRGPAGILNVMPAALPDMGYMGYKAYTPFDGKVRFYFHLYSAHTGEYLAIIEGDRLGQRRTGAASGVATKYLARADAATVGIYGTGWQAESQLEAICGVRPIRSVRCFSRDAARRNAFAEKMARRLGVAVEPVSEPRQAAHDSDILVTITTATAPVLLGDWVSSGAHINAAGGNSMQRRELDEKVITNSELIFADSLEQARFESSDLSIPAQAGHLDWSRLREIGELIAGLAPGRTNAGQITLFKSTGIAVEDVAVAGYVYEQARTANLGQPLTL